MKSKHISNAPAQCTIFFQNLLNEGCQKGSQNFIVLNIIRRANRKVLNLTQAFLILLLKNLTALFAHVLLYCRIRKNIKTSSVAGRSVARDRQAKGKAAAMFVS